MSGLPYICDACGTMFSVKRGKCGECGQFGTIVENNNYSKGVKKDTNQSGESFKSSGAQKIGDVVRESVYRYKTGFKEMDRVLGKDSENDIAGLAAGSVVLLAGGPGIGKSTLLLMVSDFLSKDYTVLYISAEENKSQIKGRADRIGMNTGDFYVSHLKELKDIENEIEEIKPDILIVDSIQTIYSKELNGRAGGMSQVVGCAETITNISKTQNITTLMVGHMTKDDSIAGPNTLKHLVDTTIVFEGDEISEYRILRSIKNRYGKEGEIGVFEMDKDGLHEVAEASQYFVRDVKESEGSALSCILEGTRPLLVEVQALSLPSTFSNPKRTASGVDYNKLNLMTAVISKHIKEVRDVNTFDVYLNITGGLKIKDPASDLAIVAAIYSSALKIAMDNSLVFIGEVGLTGDVRSVRNIDERLKEMDKLGFKKVVIGANQKTDYKGKIELIRLENISDLKDIIK